MRGSRWPGRSAVLIALLSLSGAVGGAAQTVAYVGGLQGMTGSYVFARRTTGGLWHNGVEVRMGRWTVAATVPLVAQNSPWVSWAGPGGILSGGPEGAAMDSAMRGGTGHGAGMTGGGTMGRGSVPLADTADYARVGFGDPLISSSLALMDETTGWSVRVNGTLKPPVATPTRGFGSGQWDGGVGLSVARLTGRMMWSGYSAYWRIGDLPDLALRDLVVYGVAVGRTLGSSGRWSTLVSVSGATSAVSGLGPSVQAGAGLSHLLPSGTSLGLLLTAGLTTSAPDAGISVSWRVPLN